MNQCGLIVRQAQFGKTGNFTSEQPMCQQPPGEASNEAKEKYPHDIRENPDDILCTL